MALFEARGLHKRFGQQVVLEHVDLCFEAGRLSGIIGPNGAGKTTCFNVLTGLHRPDRGQVLLDGEDITGLPPQAISRKGVARSFQTMTLFDDYSVLENVLVALPAVVRHGFHMLHDLSRDRPTLEQALAVLERVGLAGQAFAPARSLPYGDRRALDIGIALAASPRLLFLDEPTSGLGAGAVERLAALIRELRREVTVVVIEHDMRFLFELADEISVIHWGQVIAFGTPAELRANKWVQASNLGKLA
jgi:branched-chain amino acid transport system ATP-binding protein